MRLVGCHGGTEGSSARPWCRSSKDRCIVREIHLIRNVYNNSEGDRETAFQQLLGTKGTCLPISCWRSLMWTFLEQEAGVVVSGEIGQGASDALGKNSRIWALNFKVSLVVSPVLDVSPSLWQGQGCAVVVGCYAFLLGGTDAGLFN
ncbi:hypothetical protein CRG98_003106 [Punica granatum]|uniref:Uncharacterized protein n=1 Tax=Punica granatum TaxID=22663 RepID=A0A2I0L768_PUNGR|nr:hypothetical protein CRG98_003106 [Punica granatum]